MKKEKKKLFNEIRKLKEFEREFRKLLKKFTCKSLRGTGVKSGIRIIYAYYEEEDIIEFIEIFYKSDKENEDRDRIFRYYKKESEGH